MKGYFYLFERIENNCQFSLKNFFYRRPIRGIISISMFMSRLQVKVNKIGEELEYFNYIFVVEILFNLR